MIAAEGVPSSFKWIGREQVSLHVSGVGEVYEVEEWYFAGCNIARGIRWAVALVDCIGGEAGAVWAEEVFR